MLSIPTSKKSDFLLVDFFFAGEKLKTSGEEIYSASESPFKTSNYSWNECLSQCDEIIKGDVKTSKKWCLSEWGFLQSDTDFLLEVKLSVVAMVIGPNFLKLVTIVIRDIIQ